MTPDEPSPHPDDDASPQPDDHAESAAESAAQPPAQSKQRRAVARVAADPATPADELVELAKRHRWAHARLAGNHAAPSRLLNVLAESSDAHVRAVVAGNPATPDPTLARLEADAASDVSDAAIRHRAARVLPRFDEIGRWSRTAQFAASSDPQADPAVLDVLAYGQRKMRVAVATNPVTASTTLQRLAADPKPTVRRAVAGHAATPVDTLETLAGNPDRFVRREVAARQDTPPGTLARLAADPHAIVRGTVAKNARTPAAALAVLAEDADAEVRRRVAARRKLPPEAFTRLAGDDDAKVRFVVAKNPTCPLETLDELRNDPDPQVREKAIARHAQRR